MATLRRNWPLCIGIVIVLLILGFIAQATLGYWLLYRSIVNDTAVPATHFYQQLDQGDIGIAEPYIQYDYWNRPSGYWSVTTHRSIGRLTVRSSCGNPPAVHSWVTFPPSRRVTPEAFREVVPGAVVRELLKEVDGEWRPRQEEKSTIVVENCGWPLLSLVAFDFGDSSTGSIQWSARHGFVFEYQRARGQGTVTERALIPYRPLLLGTIVNSAISASLLFLVLIAALGTRRLLRYERGRCPRCAYDLRRAFHHGCSECGWGRSA